MLLGAGESWYAKADAGAWLVSPAEEHPVAEPHDAYADDMVLAEGIARYQPFVTEEVTRVTSSWAGLRTFAPDRCLVLGPDPDAPISSGSPVRAATVSRPRRPRAGLSPT
jgi:D-arginine dehydrogenase